MNRAVSFGQAVRERRGALGLTQAELARRAGCAPVTVRKIEADQLRPSVQLAELLALALNVPEKEQLAFVRLARDEPPPSPLPKPTPAPGEIGLADLSGRSVKGFDLAEQVGSGGFGVVYRAVQPSVRRDVAVKIILPRYANQPDFIRRFEAEAHLVARLEHPHIVPLYDYWREPNAAYLIMRLLRGGSLEDRLEAGALSLAEVWHIVQQVGRALGAAHQQGVIHRDIKPANVLLDEEQNGYLADFGIAKNLSVTDADFTEEGALIGSPAYISPEQIKAEPVHPASDIYCFGLLLYEILTGKPAFRGPTPVAFLQQHLNDPVPSLFEHLPKAPAALDAILQRATAKEPADRFDDMAALLDALQTVLLPLIADVELPVADTAVAPLRPEDVAALDNPYRGLRAFTEADADNFFGRETLVQALLGMLSDGSDLERFVTVVGPSGSGKSSVVRAGLLPALRRGGLPGSDNWFIIDLTPGSHPWEELEAALLRVAVNPPDSLLAQLQADNRGLLRAVRRCLPDDGETELLLVIDQFEELFTLVAEEAVRAQFLQSLVTAVLEPNSRLRVVVTMRADFTDRPLQYVDFGELMEQRLALVLPLTPDELTQVITGPVDRLGMALEPELVTAIVQDVGEQPGMLPLLQYALTELFAQRQGPTLTLDIYRETGGVTGALARRADEIYDNLDADGQALARQLFLRLITLGEGVEDTRRRVLLSEIEALSPGAGGQGSGSAEELDSRYPPRATSDVAIVNQFGKHRLLTFDHDPVTRQPTVEVAHEALLRQWPRLRAWLRDSREDVRRQRLLAQAAQQWRHNGQDASYLLRGSRLTSFEAWAETTTVALTAVEHDFLQTSINARNARQAAEEARRQRELETAQQLAEEQSQRAREQTQAAQSLRQRALYLTGALLLMVLFAATAVVFARSSGNNADLAATREAEALANLDLAATREAEANLEREAAEAAQTTAEAESVIRAAAEAEAETQRDEALASERAAQEAYSLSLAANARQALEANDTELAMLLALAANNIENPPERAYQTLVDVAYAPGAQSEWGFNDETPFTMTFLPEREVMLVSAWNIIQIRDIHSGEITSVFDGHTAPVSLIIVSPESRLILSADDGGNALLWDFDTKEIIQTFSTDGRIYGLAFLPGEEGILVGEENGVAPSNLYVWEIESGELMQKFGGTEEGNREGIRDLALLPDGRTALLGLGSSFISNPATIVFWDIETEEIIAAPPLQTLSSINELDIDREGNRAVLAASDRNVYVIDLETKEISHTLSEHTAQVTTVAMSPDGRTAVSGGRDATIIWWELETGRIINKFLGQSGSIETVTFLDNSQIASLSLNGTIRIWDLRSNWEVDRWTAGNPGEHFFYKALGISPTGDFALAGTTYNGLMKFDYQTGEASYLLEEYNARVFAVDISEDGTRAVTAMSDGSLLYWDLLENSIIGQYTGHASRVNDIDISADGLFAVSAGLDNQVFYWDLLQGEIIHKMTGHSSAQGVAVVRFLSGEQIAVSSGPNQDSSIILWDLQSGAQINRLTGLNAGDISHLRPGQPEFIYGFATSSDGRHILSAGGDQTLILWDTVTGMPVRQFDAETGYMLEVEIEPANQYAFTSGHEQALIMWDIAGGVPVREFILYDRPGENNIATSFPALALHPDGTTALTTQGSFPIVKWQLTNPESAELLTWIKENRLIREFTCLERQNYQIQPLCQNGVPQEQTAQLLESLQQRFSDVSFAGGATEEADISPLMLEPLEVETETAVFGENQGELEKGSFDVWEFAAQEGDIISIQLLADNPYHSLGETLSMREKFASDTLDTALFVTDEEGALLARASDTVLQNGETLSDAIVDAFVVPQDGTYYIEARSDLDGNSGAYSLILNEIERFPVDEALLQEYEGLYREGPWEITVRLFIEEGELVVLYEETSERFGMLPRSDNEFVLTGDGSIFIMTRDDAGQIDGYDLFLSPIYPPGGQWYRAERLGDLP